MKTKAYITANNGFTSAIMPLNQARNYAELLKALGNYNVKVIPTRKKVAT